MKLQTASSVISFARQLEEESAKFYEDLARRYAEGKDIFLSFARDNNKNVVQVQRAYYGTISDAIEGCFAFDLEPAACTIETVLAEGVSYSDALRRAIEMEEKIGKFYADAAEQSKCLLADVPRSLAAIVRKRNERILRLKSLIEKGK